MIEAKVICDSTSPAGKRLTTFKLRYPKFIHGEFMTHRVISRNASSSRAIPPAKLIEEVRNDHLRAMPVYWGAEQRGMQAATELGDDARAAAIMQWGHAACSAADYAEQLMRIGLHKQLANRLLEPFSHINVVATATEWDNFFGLRLHKDAQPEMREMAERMWQVMRESEPEELQPGEWHLPFVERMDLQACLHAAGSGPVGQMQLALKVSTARCARVSFESFETGKRSTVEEDIKLYDEKLFRPGQAVHASPAEHQAMPDIYIKNASTQDIREHGIELGWQNPGQHGNLVGWRQYRKLIAGEACAPMPDGYH